MNGGAVSNGDCVSACENKDKVTVTDKFMNNSSAPQRPPPQKKNTPANTFSYFFTFFYINSFIAIFRKELNSLLILTMYQILEKL